MSKTTCAVIGLGMGKSHIKGYRGHPDAEVVAVCDLDEGRLQAAESEWAIPGLYTDVDTMLAEAKPDVVSIATPNSLHKPFALKCLEAGAHVLCEKPMAMNQQESAEMLAAADKAGKRIMINFSYRFNDASWGMKDQVASGILGEVYGARTKWLRRDGFPGFGGWFGTKKLSGGGPLIDLGVHRIDLALWLLGYPQPKYVLANVHNHLGKARAAKEAATFDVEDYAAAMITFANGMTLQVEASWASHIRDGEEMETQLLGTKGGLRQFNTNGGYQFAGFIHTEQHGCKLDIEMKGGSAPKSAQYHFIDSIRNDTPHIATGEEGHTIMQILDAIYDSAERGGEPIAIG